MGYENFNNELNLFNKTASKLPNNKIFAAVVIGVTTGNKNDDDSNVTGPFLDPPEPPGTIYFYIPGIDNFDTSGGINFKYPTLDDDTRFNKITPNADRITTESGAVDKILTHWPVASDSIVTSPWSLNRYGKPHYGIDIGKRNDTDYTIRAAANGIVMNIIADDGIGNTIIKIKHGTFNINGQPRDIWTGYFHVVNGSWNNFNITVGSQVHGGQNIATMGSEGQSEALHLHFRVYDCPVGVEAVMDVEQRVIKYPDPMVYLLNSENSPIKNTDRIISNVAPNVPTVVQTNNQYVTKTNAKFIRRVCPNVGNNSSINIGDIAYVGYRGDDMFDNPIFMGLMINSKSNLNQKSVTQASPPYLSDNNTIGNLPVNRKEILSPKLRPGDEYNGNAFGAETFLTSDDNNNPYHISSINRGGDKANINNDTVNALVSNIKIEQLSFFGLDSEEIKKLKEKYEINISRGDITLNVSKIAAINSTDGNKFDFVGGNSIEVVKGDKIFVCNNCNNTATKDNKIDGERVLLGGENNHAVIGEELINIIEDIIDAIPKLQFVNGAGNAAMMPGTDIPLIKLKAQLNKILSKKVLL